MKPAQLFAVALMTLFATSGFAQTMHLASGNLDFLKGQKTINVVYTYDNLKVGPGTEQDYIDKKVGGYNKGQARPGRRVAEKLEKRPRYPLPAQV